MRMRNEAIRKNMEKGLDFFHPIIYDKGARDISQLHLQISLYRL